MQDERRRLLFVCLGNICRSPLAESVFRHLARERGVEQLFEMDSAGTAGYHIGDPPDARSTATARARGVTVEGVGRQISPDDFHRFDRILVMDRENLGAVERMKGRSGGAATVELLRAHDPEDRNADVPDPYYGGQRGFEEVHDIIERSCRELLEELLDDASGLG